MSFLVNVILKIVKFECCATVSISRPYEKLSWPCLYYFFKMTIPDISSITYGLKLSIFLSIHVERNIRLYFCGFNIKGCMIIMNFIGVNIRCRADYAIISDSVILCKILCISLQIVTIFGDIDD